MRCIHCAIGVCMAVGVFYAARVSVLKKNFNFCTYTRYNFRGNPKTKLSKPLNLKL